MINSILVGIDGSKHALSALRWAETLIVAGRNRGTAPVAFIVSAWSRPANARGIFKDEPFEAAARQILDDQAGKLTNPAWFEKIARNGHAADVILSEADDRDVDLIIVGSRGKSSIAQILLGSVSRVVAGRAERPVAIVPETSTPGLGPTVVGFDDSPGSLAALRWAVDNLEGEITALAVWSLPSTVVIDPDDSKVHQMEAACERALQAAVDEVTRGAPDSRITPVVRHGDPRLVIFEAATDGSQIVLGARGERGLKGLVLGSTVTYIATHSTVPVIIVPPVDG